MKLFISLRLVNIFLLLQTWYLSLTLAQTSSKYQYCQFNSDCISGCCYKEKCRDYYTCSLMSQVDQFENANYCKLDYDCTQGSQSASLCCFNQKCVESSVCIQNYYVPLIVGAVFSVVLGFIASKLIDICLRKQKERIQKEHTLKKKRKQIRKEKEDMKKLLGDEGFAKYMEENPNAFKLKKEKEKPADPVDDFLNKPEPNQLNPQMQQQQQQMQHYNFVRQHLLQNPNFTSMPPQQQHQMTLMVMQQQMQQQQQIQIYSQFKQQENFNQLKQSVQAQQKQAPNPIASQLLQPKKASNNLRPNSPIRVSQQSVGQQSSNAPNQLLSSVNASQTNPLINQNKPVQPPSPINAQAEHQLEPMPKPEDPKRPRFFGKQNALQGMVQAQNPLYPDYKPNVPNPGKMEDNIPKNPTIDNDLYQKRSILASNRRPLTKHITSQMKEGPLPK